MKKFNKNSVLALSLAAASTIAIGGTVAYNALTHDDESAQNVVTVGEAVDIAINEYQREDNKANAEKLEPFDQGKKLYPYTDSAQGSKDKWGMPAVAENYGDKIVTVKNTGKVPAKVRVFIATPLALCENTTSTNMNDAVLHSNLGNRVDLEGDYNAAFGDDWKNNWDWSEAYPVKAGLSFTATIDGVEYKVNAYEMNDLLGVGQESDAIISGVYLDSRVDYDDGVWTMGDYVIDYDLSKGINIPVYAEAVAEDVEFEPAATVFENWAKNIKAPVLVDTAEKINDALESGGTIYLTGDSTIITSDTEINLNNSSISANRSDTSSADTYSAMTVKSNVTIDGTGSVENAGGYGITVKNADATLTILDGTYKGGTTAIQVTQGELVIKGGTFEDISTEDNGHYLINCIDANYKNGTAKITIMGGTFKNWNPENNTSEGAGTNFLADGYKVVSETDANGDVWYTVVAE